ncbi:MAG: hypothetical protein H6736_24655, partial [Alphaproteobacteria bacterium]|nr:hypothetical protein [Alphaproteobacteria bacterium]
MIRPIFALSLLALAGCPGNTIDVTTQSESSQPTVDLTQEDPGVDTDVPNLESDTDTDTDT